MLSPGSSNCFSDLGQGLLTQFWLGYLKERGDDRLQLELDLFRFGLKHSLYHFSQKPVLLLGRGRLAPPGPYLRSGGEGEAGSLPPSMSVLTPFPVCTCQGSVLLLVPHLPPKAGILVCITCPAHPLLWQIVDAPLCDESNSAHILYMNSNIKGQK